MHCTESERQDRELYKRTLSVLCFFELFISDIAGVFDNADSEYISSMSP